MKNYFILLLVIPFLSLCTQENEETNYSKPTKKSVIAQPSELAVLMNDMYKVNYVWKKQIENGKIPTNISKNHQEILTAKSINERVSSDFYNAMAVSYLTNVKEVTLSNKKNVKTNFNAMISTCISCHEEICFGPISRIKKLYIK